MKPKKSDREKLEEMLKAYRSAGGRSEDLRSNDTASMVVEGNKILTSNNIEGVIIEKEETKTGIIAKIVVEEGQKIREPIHLCFGILPKEGLQEIITRITIEENASAEIKACCTFPNAKKVKHIMDAEFILKKNSTLYYQETHFHGHHGGVGVIPKTRMVVGEGAILKTTFSLTTGSVGKLDLDYGVDAKKNSTTELLMKVYGKGSDEIKIREGVKLNGENARSIIKSRIAVKDNATSEVINITEGNAPHTRGHVDCTEIVRDNAKASAIPIVSVTDEKAKVTHEAAIGTVDKKELETLMAHGLEKEEAVDVIIEGLLG